MTSVGSFGTLFKWILSPLKSLTRRTIVIQRFIIVSRSSFYPHEPQVERQRTSWPLGNHDRENSHLLIYLYINKSQPSHPHAIYTANLHSEKKHVFPIYKYSRDAFQAMIRLFVKYVDCWLDQYLTSSQKQT